MFRCVETQRPRARFSTYFVGTLASPFSRMYCCSSLYFSSQALTPFGLPLQWPPRNKQMRRLGHGSMNNRVASSDVPLHLPFKTCLFQFFDLSLCHATLSALVVGLLFHALLIHPYTQLSIVMILLWHFCCAVRKRTKKDCLRDNESVAMGKSG